jgi:DNA-binding MarR family transcriptional regulator
MITDMPDEPPGRIESTGTARLTSLQQVTAALVGVTARALAETGTAHELTLVQWRTLVVASDDRTTRVGDVAARVGLSMPSASRLVKRMHQRGLIETQRDPQNGRVLLVRLTAEGRRITESIVRRRLELVEAELAATGPLPDATDEVLRALALALSRYA